ncbi:hypothetical protein ADUPG1_012851 [Aduncisulcus paluster]|uniref:Uncharacterized protein n=1 Tax=Aduncisulcus paluster TaxID=2918883 RepID=A0ABQ5K5P6_9EUKA|nr:hypothetical protein ADUPG1_012851 [Aduncisulcus paluster]
MDYKNAKKLERLPPGEKRSVAFNFSDKFMTPCETVEDAEARILSSEVKCAILVLYDRLDQDCFIMGKKDMRIVKKHFKVRQEKIEFFSVQQEELEEPTAICYIKAPNTQEKEEDKPMKIVKKFTFRGLDLHEPIIQFFGKSGKSCASIVIFVILGLIALVASVYFTIPGVKEMVDELISKF